MVHQDGAKALDQLADIMVNLKENNCQLDLEDGTLYTTILKKIPERCYTSVL